MAAFSPVDGESHSAAYLSGLVPVESAPELSWWYGVGFQANPCFALGEFSFFLATHSSTHYL